MKKPLTARQAVGRAQIGRLEEEFRPLLAAPSTSAQCQMLFGWLESILDVGASQEMWNHSLQRAIEQLEALRRGESLANEELFETAYWR